ncbi:MAG: (2Fe-2S) ferredoxin domain-containing protein [Myxococcales bacterium]
MAHRDHYLFVCTNRRSEGHPKGSCAANGSEEVLDQLKETLAKTGVSRTVRVCASGCLDFCGVGAAVVHEPEHVVYGHVARSDAGEIASAAAAGRTVERLVIAR